MSNMFPRISILVGDNDGSVDQGEMNALSVGFGFRMAWIFSAMFGTSSVFNASTVFRIGEGPFSHITLVFLISILLFIATLIFIAITDQRFLKYYTDKRIIIISALMTFVGTLAIFAADISGNTGTYAVFVAGVLTGVGSALLMIMWGIAFARYSTVSIVGNTALAIFMALLIFSVIINIVPPPFSGIVVSILPLLELPLLWALTPVSYSIRHEVPIFDPLPINKAFFSIRLAVPVFLFGIALGNLRTMSTELVMLAGDYDVQLLAVMASGWIMMVLFLASFMIDRRKHWDVLFRPLVPFIIFTLFFIPSELASSTLLGALILLTGYMCLEALMWIFFGEISQEFRISPVYIFSVGRGSLALGLLFGKFIFANPAYYASLFTFGVAAEIVITVLIMMAAYTTFPRVRDIRRAIAIRTEDEREVESGQLREAPASTDDSSEDESLVASQGPSQVQNTFYNSDSNEGNPDESGIKDQLGNMGWFKAQCERISDRYLLTARETEVMYILAKGYNAAYLQDKLYISHSTAKTHISNIYKKLDIHSQQELIALIDEGKDEKV